MGRKVAILAHIVRLRVIGGFSRCDEIVVTADAVGRDAAMVEARRQPILGRVAGRAASESRNVAKGFPLGPDIVVARRAGSGRALEDRIGMAAVAGDFLMPPVQWKVCVKMILFLDDRLSWLLAKDCPNFLRRKYIQ